MTLPEITMHESIAHAIYRGELRQYPERLEAGYSRLEAQFKNIPVINRRGPWLRAAKFLFSNLPTFTVLGGFDVGEKKHTETYLMGLVHPKVQEAGVWHGGAVRLTAKTCKTAQIDLPIKVSHHAVIRLMQRCNVVQPNEALHWLAPAFFYAALVQRPPPAEPALLPCLDGAVIAGADRDTPDSWVFLTFVDNAKLRPDQRAELAMRLDKFHQRAAEIGWRITFRNTAGAEMRINPRVLPV